MDLSSSSTFYPNPFFLLNALPLTFILNHFILFDKRPKNPSFN